MSLSYKKVDGGEYWIYKSRFKRWQLLLIVFIPILIGYFLLPSVSLVASVISVLFGITFSFAYGMSSLPFILASRRAIKNGKKVIVEEKDGFQQFLIQK